MPSIYKIHPAIGVSRVGTSPESFAGPTVPGLPVPPSSYRDDAKRLKRQSCTFWIYAYDESKPGAAPKLIEVGPGQDVVGIEWTVHVANKKASWFNFQGPIGAEDILIPPHFGYSVSSLRNPLPPLNDPTGRRQQWIIDPGPRMLETAASSIGFSKGAGGEYAESWPEPFRNGNSKCIDTLGSMQVNADFSLTVVGGTGNSGSIDGSPIGDYANNPGWFDDTSDGSVKAKLVFKNGKHAEAVGAWVIVAPPDFAPPIENIITLYDAMRDVGLRFLGSDPKIFDTATNQFVPSFEPSFEHDIFPILLRAYRYRWVYNETAPGSPQFHSSLNRLAVLSTPPSGDVDLNAKARQRIFHKLRVPDQTHDPFDSRKMPKLYGDLGDEADGNGLTLTVTQYEIMRRWANGQFTQRAKPLPLTRSARRITAHGLDRAALEACVGGAFFPGIECGWIVREPRLYVEPFEFRFRHAKNESDLHGVSPGDVTKRSACPWQADFFQCASNWWPAQRPNQVLEPNTGKYVDWDEGVRSMIDMVHKWHAMGVVVADENSKNYIETERILPRP